MKIFGSRELSWTLSNTTFMFNIQIVFIKTKDEYEIPRLNFKRNYQLKIEYYLNSAEDILAR